MQFVRVVNQTTGISIGEKIELADTSFTRMWGLLGRTGVNAGGGLWIRPSSGVHTVGMKFPIDVLGLDKEMQVVRVWHSLAPFRVTSVSLKVRSVIELPAGTINELRIEVGDVLECSMVALADAKSTCSCEAQWI